MRKTRQTSGERIVKDIKRKTRKQYTLPFYQKRRLAIRVSKTVSVGENAG
ncbi:MAG: hypothetical protein ACSHXY_04710 [Alphaproteobacteria bacterium]